jgi:virulence-associated protein VagC
MGSFVVSAEAINLPERFAKKLKGKRVELFEKDGNIVIAPVKDTIAQARGVLKGSRFTVERFMEAKKADKELEDGK